MGSLRNLEFHQAPIVYSYQVAIERIASSDSWGFLPDWMIKEDARLKVLPPPTGWDANFTITLVWPKNRTVSQAVHALVQVLKENF